MTFGGFNSLFGSNAKEVAETTNRLTESNERLKNAVDSLKDEISKTGGKNPLMRQNKPEKTRRPSSVRQARFFKPKWAIMAHTIRTLITGAYKTRLCVA